MSVWGAAAPPAGAAVNKGYRVRAWTAVGTPDIALCPLLNVGGRRRNAARGARLDGQIAPKLIAATFSDLNGATLAAAEWKGTFTTRPPVTISCDQLPSQTTVLFMGCRRTATAPC